MCLAKSCIAIVDQQIAGDAFYDHKLKYYGIGFSCMADRYRHWTVIMWLMEIDIELKFVWLVERT